MKQIRINETEAIQYSTNGQLQIAKSDAGSNLYYTDWNGRTSQISGGGGGGGGTSQYLYIRYNSQAQDEGMTTQPDENTKYLGVAITNTSTPPTTGYTWSLIKGPQGEQGPQGIAAGFGAPTSTVNELDPGAVPTVAVSASGDDTSKIFSFTFGIPEGKGIDSLVEQYAKGTSQVPGENWVTNLADISWTSGDYIWNRWKINYNDGSTAVYTTPQKDASQSIITSWAYASDKTKIDGSKIANGTVGSNQIADNAIIPSKIANNAVLSTKIANSAITTGKIADGAVNSNKIANSAVNSNKIATSAVTTGKIANNAVTTDKIANDAVTEDKISVSNLSDISNNFQNWVFDEDKTTLYGYKKTKDETPSTEKDYYYYLNNNWIKFVGTAFESGIEYYEWDKVASFDEKGKLIVDILDAETEVMIGDNRVTLSNLATGVSDIGDSLANTGLINFNYSAGNTLREGELTSTTIQITPNFNPYNDNSITLKILKFSKTISTEDGSSTTNYYYRIPENYKNVSDYTGDGITLYPYSSEQGGDLIDGPIWKLQKNANYLYTYAYTYNTASIDDFEYAKIIRFTCQLKYTQSIGDIKVFENQVASGSGQINLAVNGGAGAKGDPGDPAVTYEILLDRDKAYRFSSYNTTDIDDQVTDEDIIYEVSPDFITISCYRNQGSLHEKITNFDTSTFILRILIDSNTSIIAPSNYFNIQLTGDFRFSFLNYVRDVKEYYKTTQQLKINYTVQIVSISNGVENILASSNITFIDGTADDRLQLTKNATNLSLAIDKTGLKFSANGVDIYNGGIRIHSSKFNETQSEDEIILDIDNQGNLVTKGEIYARSGVIGNDIAPWTIGSSVTQQGNEYSAIYSGKSSINSSNSGAYIGTNGIRIDNGFTGVQFGVDGSIFAGHLNRSKGYLEYDTTDGLKIVGYITATGGSIGGWTIEDGWLYSGSGASYVGLSASVGDYAIWAGSSTASSAPFYVQRDGTLYSKRGYIGSWTISANDLHSGSGTSYIGLGNGGNGYCIWAGNNTAASAPFSVKKDGSLYATKGSIGGWTIETGFLHSGSSTSYAGLSSASNYAIWAGDSQAEKAPFGVERNGTLHATGAQIIGNITATTLVLGTSAKSTLDGYYDGLGSAATAVNNLQIGARNLFKKSKKYSLDAGTNNWSYWSVYWTEPLQKDQTYTISGYVEFTQGSSEVITIHRGYGGSAGALDGSVNVNIQAGGYFEHTWTCAHNVTTQDRILLYCGEAGSTANKKCTYSFVKLEKGTKATGWLDAPEDLTFMVPPSRGTKANFTDRDGNEFNFGIDASGNLYANNGSFTGTITATGGAIGSSTDATKLWKIGGTSIYNGKQTFTEAKSGIYVGTDGISSTYKGTSAYGERSSGISNGMLFVNYGQHGAIIEILHNQTYGYFLSLCGGTSSTLSFTSPITKIVCGLSQDDPSGSLYCVGLCASGDISCETLQVEDIILGGYGTDLPTSGVEGQIFIKISK